MRAEDLFFLQIQGSGYLTFEDGTRGRAAYAADNGKPFVGIARPMAQQGLLPQNGTSGDAIRDWLASHRGYEAQAVMALDTLLNAMVLDGRVTVGAAAGIRASLDRAYEAVKSPESYNPVRFRAALGQAASAIGSLR